MLIFLKVLLQLVTVVSAIVSSSLDYKWHDKRTKSFKTGRIILFTLTGVLLLLSIGVTIVDDYQSNRKEEELSADLKKVQGQNDGLQQSIKVLGVQSSDLLQKQEEGLVSLLVDQRTLNDQTGTKIERASDLLQSNIKETVAKQSTTLANITGGDSFCYVSPELTDDTVKWQLKSRGKFPLYDIAVSVEEIFGEKIATYQSPTVSTMVSKPLGELSLQSITRKDLEITMRTRYAVFKEIVKLVKVKEDWLVAYLVYKPDFVQSDDDDFLTAKEEPKPYATPPRRPISGGILSYPPGRILLVSVDYNFPRNENGYVDWFSRE